MYKVFLFFVSPISRCIFIFIKQTKIFFLGNLTFRNDDLLKMFL